MKLYLVSEIIMSYIPPDKSINNKLFKDRDKAVKYFNECVKQIRIDAYEIDNKQGYLIEEDSFELCDPDLDYDVLLTLQEVNIE